MVCVAGDSVTSFISAYGQKSRSVYPAMAWPDDRVDHDLGVVHVDEPSTPTVGPWSSVYPLRYLWAASEAVIATAAPCGVVPQSLKVHAGRLCDSRAVPRAGVQAAGSSPYAPSTWGSVRGDVASPERISRAISAAHSSMVGRSWKSPDASRPRVRISTYPWHGGGTVAGGLESAGGTHPIALCSRRMLHQSTYPRGRARRRRTRARDREGGSAPRSPAATAPASRRWLSTTRCWVVQTLAHERFVAAASPIIVHEGRLVAGRSTSITPLRAGCTSWGRRPRTPLEHPQN